MRAYLQLVLLSLLLIGAPSEQVNAQAGYAMMNFVQQNTAVLPPVPAGVSLPTTNLACYYEADDASTITQVANIVSRWNDKYIYGIDLTQATVGVRPTWNGTNAITLASSSVSGVEQFLASAACTLRLPITVYMIGKTINTSGFANCYVLDDVGGNYILYNGENSGHRMYLQGPSSMFNALSMSDNTVYCFKWVINGASSSVQYNNTTATTGDLSTTANMTAGFRVGYNSTGATASTVINGLYVYENGAAPDVDAKAYFTFKWGLP